MSIARGPEMLRLTRRYRFCASHRLHSPALSEAENRELYGKCNNPHGHGHDYLLEITVAGPLETKTGKLVNVTQMDCLVDESILRSMDHRDLNSEVPEFAHMVPTSENLALAIGRRLNESWTACFGSGGPQLDNVRLHETRRNRFELKP